MIHYSKLEKTNHTDSTIWDIAKTIKSNKGTVDICVMNVNGQTEIEIKTKKEEWVGKFTDDYLDALIKVFNEMKYIK